MTFEGAGKCPKCGKGGPRLGGHYGPDAFCRCIEVKRTATPRAPRRNTSVESSSLSIVEQLELLVNLRLQGALTEEEFVTLKTRLIARGD